MSDISLLPEELRRKEDESKKVHTSAESVSSDGLKMHIPDAEVDEDIEIIEVDEGDLAAVLSEEPFMTRFTYHVSLFADKVKAQLFGKKDNVPPPKLPPQFFKPPKESGLVSKPLSTPSVGVQQGQKPVTAPSVPGVRIVPSPDTPRRVRVIKRIRKPVRVSLISDEDVAMYGVDVGKRKWTLAFVIMLFAALVGGGYWLLLNRVQAAEARLADVTNQTTDVSTAITARLNDWKKYEDLELRLTLLDTVLNNHVVITRLFDFLEYRTLPTVSYGNATWAGDGKLNLSVNASSYDTTAQQIRAFEQSPIVQKVDAMAFSTQLNAETGLVESVTFQALLDLDIAALRGPALTPTTEETSATITTAIEGEQP